MFSPAMASFISSPFPPAKRRSQSAESGRRRSFEAVFVRSSEEDEELLEEPRPRDFWGSLTGKAHSMKAKVAAKVGAAVQDFPAAKAKVAAAAQEVASSAAAKAEATANKIRASTAEIIAADGAWNPSGKKDTSSSSSVGNTTPRGTSSSCSSNGGSGPRTEEDEKVEMISALGFSPVAARLAVTKSGGNPDAAVNWLLQEENSKQIQALELTALPSWALAVSAEVVDDTRQKNSPPRSRAAPPAAPPRNVIEFSLGGVTYEAKAIRKQSADGRWTHQLEYLVGTLGPENVHLDEEHQMLSDVNGCSVLYEVKFLLSATALALEDACSSPKKGADDEPADDGFGLGTRRRSWLRSPAAEQRRTLDPAATNSPRSTDSGLEDECSTPKKGANDEPADDGCGLGTRRQSWVRCPAAEQHSPPTTPQKANTEDAARAPPGDAEQVWLSPHKDNDAKLDNCTPVSASAPVPHTPPSRRLSLPRGVMGARHRQSAPSGHPSCLWSATTSPNGPAASSRLQDPAEDVCDDLTDDESDVAPLPPDSCSWDWPLSRIEKKTRVTWIDQYESELDRRSLEKEINYLRGLWAKQQERDDARAAAKAGTAAGHRGSRRRRKSSSQQHCVDEGQKEKQQDDGADGQEEQEQDADDEREGDQVQNDGDDEVRECDDEDEEMEEEKGEEKDDTKAADQCGRGAAHGLSKLDEEVLTFDIGEDELKIELQKDEFN